MSIQLTLGELAITFVKFLDPKFPRIRAIEGGKVEYSNNGAPYGFGPVFELPHLWTFSAYISPQESEVIGALYFDHDLRRRSLQDADIMVMDLTQKYQELSPRTRRLVDGTQEFTLGNNYVSYYPVFKAWFAKVPEFQKDGGKIIATITLQETTKVSAN